jgi:hypothetical protein
MMWRLIKYRNVIIFIRVFLLTLQLLWALASFYVPDLFTIGRTPWTSDQLVARPLPKHMSAQTQNKHIYTPNTHALSGIRTRDHIARASEDSSCLRPLGYRNRLYNSYVLNILKPKTPITVVARPKE